MQDDSIELTNAGKKVSVMMSTDSEGTWYVQVRGEFNTYRKFESELDADDAFDETIENFRRTGWEIA